MTPDNSHPENLRKPLKCPALRGDVTQAGVTCAARLYPAFSSDPLPCPCPGHFAEAGCGKTRRCQDQEMLPGRWVIRPASRCLLLGCPSKIPRVKFHSVTIAHKGSNISFQSSGGARMPPAPRDGHKPSQKGRHGDSCFQAMAQDEIYGYWQRKPCRKNYWLAFYFEINILGTLSSGRKASL